MKRIYLYQLACLLIVLLASACSRSGYTFRPTRSAYHDLTSAPPAAATAPAAASAVPARAAAPVPVPVPTRPAARTAAAAGSGSPHILTAIRSQVMPPAGTKAAKLLQRLSGQQTKHFETARKRRGSSGAGRAGIIIGIGALLIVLGGLAQVDIIVTLGGVTFIVGLIMLIIALFRG